MSTQERLVNYQQQLQQITAQERQMLGQIADLEEQAAVIRNRKMTLSGAIQALEEEIRIQALEEEVRQQTDTAETESK